MNHSNLTDRLAYFSNRFANADSALIEEAVGEIERLLAVNAELLAKLEKLARILGGGPIPGKGSAKALAAECRAVLAKAKGE